MTLTAYITNIHTHIHTKCVYMFQPFSWVSASHSHLNHLISAFFWKELFLCVLESKLLFFPGKHIFLISPTPSSPYSIYIVHVPRTLSITIYIVSTYMFGRFSISLVLLGCSLSLYSDLSISTILLLLLLLLLVFQMYQHFYIN
jgi:hypothetical protein